MKVGVISDIHANLPALESVLDDMPDVDQLLCCGDIVGYGPYPRECVNSIRDEADLTIVGNHDTTVIEGRTYHSTTARHGIEFAKQQLYQEDFDWLASLPKTIKTDEFQVVHSHPEPNNIAHVYEAELENAFAPHFEQEIFIYGHTHEPVNTIVDDTLVVNPGSVGQPRDRNPRAAYAVVDTDTITCTLHRVEYDLERTVEKLKEEQFPTEMVDRIRKGR